MKNLSKISEDYDWRSEVNESIRNISKRINELSPLLYAASKEIDLIDDLTQQIYERYFELIRTEDFNSNFVNFITFAGEIAACRDLAENLTDALEEARQNIDDI